MAALGADFFAKLVGEAIQERGRAMVALSGGSTPEKMYRQLGGRADITWTRTKLFLSDERFVPLVDGSSNFALVERTLLSGGMVPTDNLLPVPTNACTPERAADFYESLLGQEFGAEEVVRPPQFDLILLGLGEDGHTASLFPRAAALKVTDRWVVATPPGTLPPAVDRITFTYPVLNAARQVLFVVTGAAKAGILRTVLEDAPTCEERPAACVKPSDGEVTWLVDEAAASLLRQPK